MALALFGRLGGHPLAHEEPRRALIALELLYADNGMQPTLHGENYYRKPPLYNWVMASFYQMTGSTSEWVSRLPSAISFLLIGWFMFWLGSQYLSRSHVLLAMVIFLASEDLVLYYSRMAEMDLFYSLLTLPVLLLPWHYLNKGKTVHFFLIPPFLAGLGFLSKGFPSVPFLGISMLCAIVLHKKYRLFWSPMVLASVVVALLPTLFYFIPQYQAGTLSDSLNTLFGESANRTGGSGILGRLGHLVFFPLDTLKGMLPFSLLILWIRKPLFKPPFLKATLVLFLANYAVYLVAPGARLRYIYMLFPLLSFLFATGVTNISESWIDRFKRISTGLVLFSVLLLLGLLFYFQVLDFLLATALVVLIAFYLLKTGKYGLVLNIFVVMLVVRIGIDFIGTRPEVLGTDKSYMEKEDALNLVASYPDIPVYLNSRSEQYYTFSYEYTRLKKAVLKHNEALDDKNGIYIVRRASKPEELRLLSDFKIGKDTSFILATWP